MDQHGVELEPWLVLCGRNGELEFALWRIESTQEDALVLFSTREKAGQYVESVAGAVEAHQPQTVELGQILVQAYQQGLRWATLDPSLESAGTMYKLADVLKALREQLRSS